MKKKRIIKVPCKAKEKPDKAMSYRDLLYIFSNFFKDDTNNVSKNIQLEYSEKDEHNSSLFTLGCVIAMINNTEVNIDLRFINDYRIIYGDACHVISMITNGSLAEEFEMDLNTLVDKVQIRHDSSIGIKEIKIILQKPPKEVNRSGRKKVRNRRSKYFNRDDDYNNDPLDIF